MLPPVLAFGLCSKLDSFLVFPDLVVLSVLVIYPVLLVLPVVPVVLVLPIFLIFYLLLVVLTLTFDPYKELRPLD